MNEYPSKVCQEAITLIQEYNLIQAVRSGQLTSKELVDYLDALFIISHRKVSAYKEFTKALSSLEIIKRISPLLKAVDIPKSFWDKLQKFIDFATIRKLTYPKPLLDFLAQPYMRKFIKGKPDARGTVVNPGGAIKDKDLANEVNWPEVDFKAELVKALAQKASAQGKSLADYLSPFMPLVEVGIAGQASRILKLFRNNKMFGMMIRIKPGQEEKMLEYFRAQGFQNFKLVKYGDYSYLGISHLVLARNPGAIIIAGLPTIEPSETWVGETNNYILHTQDMTRTLNIDGSFTEDLSIAGHGRLIALIMEAKSDIIRLLRAGKVWQHVQGDDLGDRENSQLMAYKIQTGSTPLVFLTTPQRIIFKNNYTRLHTYWQNGEKLSWQGQEIVKVEENKLILSSGDSIEVFQIIEGLNQTLEEVERLKDRADQLSGQEQRDVWIEAMELYQKDIYNKVKELEIEVGDKSQSLIEIIANKGGHALEIDGETVLIENSQYKKQVKMLHSTEGEIEFPLDVFLAIVPKYFNTNNF